MRVKDICSGTIPARKNRGGVNYYYLAFRKAVGEPVAFYFWGYVTSFPWKVSSAFLNTRWPFIEIGSLGFLWEIYK